MKRIAILLLLTGCIEHNSHRSYIPNESASANTMALPSASDKSDNIDWEKIPEVESIADGKYEANIQTINLTKHDTSYVSKHNKVNIKNGIITCIYFKNGSFIESSDFTSVGIVDDNGISKIGMKDSVDYLITVDK